jgi:glycosyltransferase involved in cell wall biosynthesis
MPVVSILIPVYNSPHFAAALTSALDQNYADLEIVVSDDSTNDDAEATVASKADPRIRYVRNTPSLGFHGNFAQCYRLARGQYLKFLNHDDILRRDCVTQMVDGFTQLGSAVSLVFVRRARIDERGNVLADDRQSQPIAQRNGSFRGAMLANHCLNESANRIGEPSAVMFRRDDVAPDPSSLFCLYGREYTCLADLALWFRLLAKGDAYYIADSLCGYRAHEAQLQKAAPVRTLCRTERFYLPRDARGLGFLNADEDYRRVLTRSKQHIEWAMKQADLTTEEQAICAQAMSDHAAETARIG